MTIEVDPPQWAIGDPGRAALELPDGPPSLPAGHADVEISSAAVNGMIARAASVRGILRRSRARNRQDAFALGLRESDGALVAAVCDGVGSLGRSHEASGFASRELVASAVAGLGWPEAFARVNAALQGPASRANGDPGEGMATTAIALVVRREAGAWVGELAWVGDSSCWHLRPDGRWQHLAGSPPEEDSEDGFYTGSVRPLPSADGACEVLSVDAEGGALFLMTDGVANPLKWGPDVQETLATWWGRPPDVLTFAGQVGFARKTHMDDRTAVGLWPGGRTDGAGDAHSQD